MNAKTRTFVILVELVAFVILITLPAILPVRVYNGLNKGIVSDGLHVGLELVGDPGFFVCYQSRLAPLFPDLVVDC